MGLPDIHFSLASSVGAILCSLPLNELSSHPENTTFNESKYTKDAQIPLPIQEMAFHLVLSDVSKK